MSYTEIELLENRLDELEKQVYGFDNKSNVNVPTPVVESLVHADTLLSSTLPGHEKAIALIKRIPELENYLDPDFEDVDIQNEAKVQYILSMESEIRDNVHMLSKMKELLPVLDSTRFQKSLELAPTLNDLTIKYLSEYEKSESVTNDIRDMISKYNDVITSISKSLIAIDAEITAAEIAAAPKKQMD